MSPQRTLSRETRSRTTGSKEDDNVHGGNSGTDLMMKKASRSNDGSGESTFRSLRGESKFYRTADKGCTLISG